MMFSDGTRLGHYKILESIGVGGMGEVYRARDLKLDREVAIKVLPEAFSQDKESLARFEREARLLASLNHPNIATLFDFQEYDGVHFLVLEFVPGETLAQRIAQGRRLRQGFGEPGISIEEALPIFKQIAEALEAAHEKGIIHRDLKPANIKVTPEGNVKVLDFGLAKAHAADVAARDLSESPTVTREATGTGVLLGTAPYMSPEQARGKPVDKRADIWAFGCCLFEALTGRKTFQGNTVTDTFAAIINKEPNWESLPTATPHRTRELIQRCLRKEARFRLRDIGDAWVDIQEFMTMPAAEHAGDRKAGGVSWGVAVLASLLLAFVVGLSVWIFTTTASREPAPVTHFDIVPPHDSTLGFSESQAAFSPDGAQLAYIASRDSVSRLYIRSMNEPESRPISGTEGAVAPFFSPDGQWVGFFAYGKLRKVSMAGGAPMTLCDAQPVRSASWGHDDIIIFNQKYGSPLSQVTADGKSLRDITRLETAKGECEHSYPDILPGGESVLFTVWTGVSFDHPHVAVQALGGDGDDRQHRILVEGASNPRYAATGHIIYLRAGMLYAAPFDLPRLEVTGSPVPLIEGVGRSQFHFSRSGSLAYIDAGAIEQNTLVWVDRKGSTEAVTQTRKSFAMPRISPDGARIALNIFDGSEYDVWIYDLAQDTLSRLTFENGNAYALWTPDGRRMTFSSDRNGPVNVFWKPADGSEEAKRILKSDTMQLPSSWSPDGRFLAVTEVHPATAGNVWVFSMDETHRRMPFLETPFDEYEAVFSPDGRWLAYTSNESDRDEIYVRPFPGPGGKLQISSGGGSGPVWASDGRELFYLSGSRMISVVIETEPELKVVDSRVLFETDFERSGLAGFRNYDVAPDGERFVMVRGDEQQKAPTQIHIVLNWFEELKRLAPTR